MSVEGRQLVSVIAGGRTRRCGGKHDGSPSPAAGALPSSEAMLISGLGVLKSLLNRFGAVRCTVMGAT